MAEKSIEMFSQLKALKADILAKQAQAAELQSKLAGKQER